MRWLNLVAAVLLLFGCMPKRHLPPPPSPPVLPMVQYGWASWYGEEFHGKPTASGAIYNMYELTAAHRTLPLGTRVMVTHLRKGRSVMVTINDRGPFVPGRIIDLSYAAAKMLDMLEEGVAWVKVEVVSLPEGFKGLGYTVQVGAFSNRERAEELKEELRSRGFNPFITLFETTQGRYWRVRIGNFSNREAAEAMAQRLSALGYDVIVMPH